MTLFLAATLLLSVPLMAILPEGLRPGAARALGESLVNGLTVGDFLFAGLALAAVIRRARFEPARRSPVLFLTLAWIVPVAGLHYFAGPGKSPDLDDLLHAVFLAGLWLVASSPADPRVAAPAFIRTVFAFALVCLLAEVTGWRQTFQYLPTYSGYIDLLVYRFRGFAANTNTFAACLLSAAMMYFLLPRKSSAAPIEEWCFIALLVALSLLMRGRHSLLILAGVALWWLSRRSRLTPAAGLVVQAVTLALIIISLVFALLPLRAEWPFLNTNPSAYALVHRTHLALALDKPFFGRPKSEIMARYPEFVDSAAVRASIESRAMRDPALVPVMIRSFNNFHAAHCAPLDFASKYGLPAAILIIGAQLAILAGFYRRFGLGLETHLVLVSSYRLLFSDPARGSMALLFIQASYLAMARKAPDLEAPGQSTAGVR
jgi:hypothetical protein